MSSSAGVTIDSIVDRMKGNSASAGSLSQPAPIPSPTPSAGATRTGTPATAVNEALMKAIRMNEQTNEAGLGALASLGKQTETIQRSLNTVEDTHANLRDSRRTLRDMKFQYWKDRLGKALVIVCLLGIIAVIVYVKWIRRLRS